MRTNPIDIRLWEIPSIGQRILKTTVAVFLCLLTYLLLGYRGESIPTEAAITAIICMQPYVSRTAQYALNRFIGTVIGSFWALSLLLLLHLVPTIGHYLPLPHLLMAVGVMLSLYTATLLHRSDASGQAAIVFLCIVISFPDVESPLRQTALRLADVFLGTLIAIGVNTFRLPRRKDQNRLFFLRAKDLVPDRFSKITPATLFRMNRLADDGAKICLMSEHAPAFFAQSMGAARLNTPLIVMDGAAIFDLNDNAFLWKNTISKTDSTQLRNYLDGLGLSYFIYTIHKDKTCIFHRGKYREEERQIFDLMRRSPYRSYLDEELYEMAEIVYFKLIVNEADCPETEALLLQSPLAQRLRIVTREQGGAPGLKGIYLYDTASSPKDAQNALMKLLRQQNPALEPEEIVLDSGYHSEHDALRLLHMVEQRYEPVVFLKKKSNI